MASFSRTAHVSIKDIARAAGVSHSTVSRALQGVPVVKRETAERIQQIALEAGYTASAVARSLVTRKTRTIGVVVTTITDPFHHEIISGVDEVANEWGYSVILADSRADPEREIRVVRSFHERRVDGIIVMSSRVGALYMPMLTEMKVPIVIVNNQRGAEEDFVHSVTIDNVEAARIATRHLVELGHTRIAYLGNLLGVYSDTERFAGYRHALMDANIPFQAQLVAHCQNRPEDAMVAMRNLLMLPQVPTAVFCYNDLLALGVLKASGGGVRVPHQISIVGFDDLFFASFLDPSLTTVQQPKKEMGRLAMDLLFRLLRGEEVEKTIHVKGTLIVRDSTAPPPT
jgi:LacI family transcriptional regulator/LacI family repressor for deo operon, udp, cdd, tsx, nupC, and nupG